MYRISETCACILTSREMIVVDWKKSVSEARGGCYSYLALVAALSSEADYVFIPEDPAPHNWNERLCSKLEQVGLPGKGALNVCVCTSSNSFGYSDTFLHTLVGLLISLSYNTMHGFLFL